MNLPKPLNQANQNFDNSGIDLRLLLLFAWKNRYIILLVMALALVAGYMVNKYSVPKYSAKAVVQFKEFDPTSSLDFTDFLRPGNVDRLNEEMTVITSRTYKYEALKELPLEWSLVAKGRIRNTNTYTIGPFSVDVEVLDSSIIGKKILLKPVSNGHMECAYPWKGETQVIEMELNKPYSTAGFNITLIRNNNRPLAEEYELTIHEENQVVKGIEKRIKIDAENTYGGKIVVEFADVNYQRAMDVVNTIAKAIVDNGLTRKSESANSIISFIQQQIDSLEDELYVQENILKDFKKNAQLISPTIAEQTLMGKFDELDQEKLDVTLEERSLKWLMDYANNRIDDLDALSGYFGNLKYSNFSPYFNTLTDLEKQKANLLLSLPSTDPKVSLLTRQIADVKVNFREALVNAQEQLTVRRNYLDEQERKFEAQFLQLPEKESEYMRLTRLSDIKEKYYLLLKEKQAEYEITLAGLVSDYVVLDSATEYVQVSPNVLQVWGVAIMAGLLLSFSFVYYQYVSNDTIFGVPDITKRTDVPIAGVLPYYEELTQNAPSVVVSNRATSIISEAFRGLRTSILQHFSKLPPSDVGRIIAITSTVSGEGKTFVTANLSRSLSLMGKRVIVVDFDLRKPKVGKAFQETAKEGVATILNENVDWRNKVIHSERFNVDLLLSGPVPPNPAELLAGPGALALLRSLQEEYDFVIVDNAPVGMVSDVIPLLAQVDVVLYMMRAYFSKRGFIENVDRLTRFNDLEKLQIILNNIGEQSGYGEGAYGYGYGYGYSYGYGYGYGYGSDGYLEDRNRNKGGKGFLKRLLRKK